LETGFHYVEGHFRVGDIMLSKTLAPKWWLSL